MGYPRVPVTPYPSASKSFSPFTPLSKRLLNRLKVDGTFRLSNVQPDGSQLYTYKDDKGNVVRRWRTPKDRQFEEMCNNFQDILKENYYDLRPDYYKAKENAIEHSAQYRCYNLLHLISKQYATVSVGKGVTVESGVPNFDRWVESELINPNIIQWVIEADAYGVIGLKLAIDAESASFEIQKVRPQELFVKFREGSDQNIEWTSHRRVFQKEDLPDWERIRDVYLPRMEIGPDSVHFFVHEERHFPGFYENYLYAIGDRDTILMTFPAEFLPVQESMRRPAVHTGLSDFALLPFYNTAVDGEFIGTWKGIYRLNDHYNDRDSRSAEVLDKFESPKMIVPHTMLNIDSATGKSYFPMRREGVLVVRDTDTHKPEFLQPNADMTGSQADKNNIKVMLSFLAEVNPAFLDADALENISSGILWKLKMTPTINKAERVGSRQELMITRIVENVRDAVHYYCDGQYLKDLQQSDDPKKQAVLDAIEAATNEYQHSFGELLELFEQKNVAPGVLFDEKDMVPEDRFGTVQPKKPFPNNLRKPGGKPPEKEGAKTPPAVGGEAAGEKKPEGESQSTDEQAPAPGGHDPAYFLDSEQLADLDRTNATQNAIRTEMPIIVNFIGSLPQDEQQLLDRFAGQQSISLETLLKRLDNHSPETLQQEMAAIKGEQEITAQRQLEVMAASPGDMGYGQEGNLGVGPDSEGPPEESGPPPKFGAEEE